MMQMEYFISQSNKVMAILFTANELANGIIVDENSRESTKTPLDNTKITLLKSLYLKLISILKNT